MGRNNDYRLFELDNLKGGHTFTYFLLVMLPYPLINMVLFCVPIYFSFRAKSIAYFILYICIFLIAEYFVYIFFTSGKHIDMIGVYNAIISVGLLFLFFYKQIIILLKNKTLHINNRR